MRVRVLILLCLAGPALCTLAGCRAGDPDPYAPVSREPVLVEAVPAPVLAAFRSDFPSAGITDVERQATSTRELLYKIVYIKDGQAGQAIYFSDGKLLRKNR